MNYNHKRSQTRRQEARAVKRVVRVSGMILVLGHRGELDTGADRPPVPHVGTDPYPTELSGYRLKAQRRDDEFVYSIL